MHALARRQNMTGVLGGTRNRDLGEKVHLAGEGSWNRGNVGGKKVPKRQGHDDMESCGEPKLGQLVRSGTRKQEDTCWGIQRNCFGQSESKIL